MYSKLSYTHLSPILGQKSIPLCARLIGRTLLTPAAVTQEEGVGGQRAAILASETHTACMNMDYVCMQLGSVVCSVKMQLTCVVPLDH